MNPLKNLSSSHSAIPIPSRSYAYLTRNVDSVQLLATIPNLDRGVQKIVEALKKADWSDPIFDDANFPYFALAAYRDNLIGKESFATAQFYWSVLQHHEKQEIEVKRTDEGDFPLLSSTFYKFVDDFLQPELSEEQIIQFLSLLNEYPASERCFFVVPDLEKAIPFQATLSRALKTSANFHIFNRVDVDGKTKRMIPSFGMMQAYCKVTGGNPAVTITPTLGLSKKEDIKQNGRSDTRDMAIPFPGVYLPAEADQLPCPQKYDFPLHDFYHAKVASHVPSAHRKAIIYFSTLIKNQLDESTELFDRTFYGEWEERVIDLEAPKYQKINNVEEAFWTHLNQTVRQTTTRIINRMKRLNFTNHHDVSNFYQERLAERELVGKVMQAFMSKKYLFSQYGIGYAPMTKLAAHPKIAKAINVCAQGVKYHYGIRT